MTGNGKTAVRGGFRRVPGSVQRRHHPAVRRAAADRQHTDRQLHDHQRAALDAAQPEPGHGALDQSRLQTAAHLQLQHGRAARSRLEAAGRRGVCRLERAPPAPDPQHQRGAVRHELPAIEYRPDDGRAASRGFPATVSRLRRHPPQRVRRLLGLRRVADGHQSALLARPPVRPVVHALEGQERRRQRRGTSIRRSTRSSTSARATMPTSAGGTT